MKVESVCAGGIARLTRATGEDRAKEEHRLSRATYDGRCIVKN